MHRRIPNLSRVFQAGAYGRPNAPAWNPTNVSSLVDWYDGSARIYSDAGTTACIEGAAVRQWTGYSSGVLSEATTANQLVYHLGANNEGYVQGDASRSIIGTFAGGSTAFSACEVWITFKRPGNMGAGEAAQISRASDNVPLIQFSRIANTTVCAIARNNASTLVQTTTTTISDTSWQVLRASWDGANASFYKDGVLVESKALTGTLTMDKFSILGNVAGAGKLAAQVAQALIFNSALSAGNATLIQSYLSSRFPT